MDSVSLFEFYPRKESLTKRFKFIVLKYQAIFCILEVHKTKEITIHYAEDDECGFNRKYTYCGNSCNSKCGTFNHSCKPECTRGCLCKKSYAESNVLGLCIPVQSPLCKWDRLWRA